MGAEMADFDPDAYLHEKTMAPAFDPDAYLSAKAEAFQPDTTTPALDATGTAALHFARHGLAGLGDKAIAAIQAARDVAADKTGKHAFPEAYKRYLGFLDKTAEASDEAHPVARWAGNILGSAGNAAMLGAALPRAAAAASMGQKAIQGAKVGATLGAASGYGGSRADSALGALEDTGAGAVMGGAAGAAAPYVAEGVGRGAQALGNRAQNAAAWLKVHSLHPTPTLGERMADLPGGEIGVGRELLERGIGGLTKKSTAAQIDAASEGATKVAGQLSRAYDESGGGQLDIAPAIFRGAIRAQELQAEPTTAPAGQKLQALIDQYAEKYRNGTTTASDALRLKRALGKVAYGSKVALGNGDTLAGEYGEGVGQIQRGVDDALDSALGPEFADANLRVRQFMGAGQAADRGAARTQGNAHLLGALPALAGMGGLATGHGVEGIGAAAGAALLQKYGSQAGARLLYSPVGGGLMGLGQALRSVPAAGAALASDAISPRTAALIAALRNRAEPMPLPQMASLEDSP